MSCTCPLGSSIMGSANVPCSDAMLLAAQSSVMSACASARTCGSCAAALVPPACPVPACDGRHFLLRHCTASECHRRRSSCPLLPFLRAQVPTSFIAMPCVSARTIYSTCRTMCRFLCAPIAVLQCDCHSPCFLRAACSRRRICCQSSTSLKASGSPTGALDRRLEACACHA